MTVTIRDIARNLNLSIAAVSRAMDGYPDISEETRRRVLQAAEEMGYVPNRAARQLRRKKADAIGYVLPANTPRFTDPFFTEFVAGLGDETARHPFDLTISIAPPGEEAEKHLYQNWVQGRKVDGFILTHLRTRDWRVEYLSAQGFPFAALETTPGDRDFPRVDVDRQAGIIKLLAHLTSRGFKRIACIGGPEDLQIQASQSSGYLQGLAAAGIAYDADLVRTGDLTSAGGYQVAGQLLASRVPLDAIICINDETAFGVLHAAREAGCNIGKDIAIAGFDGVQLSNFTDPPLTTLDIPIYEIACRLIQMLRSELMKSPQAERAIVIQPALVTRQSTTGSIIHSKLLFQPT